MLLIFSFTTYIGFTFVEFEHFVWILGIILLSILICPLRIFYYDARKWFIIALVKKKNFASILFKQNEMNLNHSIFHLVTSCCKWILSC